MVNICGRNFIKIYQFLRNTAILPYIKERLWEWAREVYFGILSDQNEIAREQYKEKHYTLSFILLPN